MTDLFIWLMGEGKERGKIIIDLCEMTGFGIPLALGVMLMRSIKRSHRATHTDV